MAHLIQTLSGLRAFAALLFLLASVTGVAAQDSIVAYSDTTSALQDPLQDDSIWTTSSSPLWPDEDLPDGFDEQDIFDLMSGLLGLTGIFAIVIGAIILLSPLLAIGLIVYLVYRLNREKQRNREPVPPASSGTEAERIIRYKETAIRRACWGAGLILTEWLADIGDLLYVIGVALLCMAAYNWMNAQIRK